MDPYTRAQVEGCIVNEDAQPCENFECPACDGKGVEECGATYTCMTCGGTGQVDADGFMVNNSEGS